MYLVLSLLIIAIVRYALWILNWRDTLVGMARSRFRRHVGVNRAANSRYRRLYARSLKAEVVDLDFDEGMTDKQCTTRLRMLERVDDGLIALDELLYRQATKDSIALYLMSKDQLTVIANNHIEWTKLHDDIDATLDMHMDMRKRLVSQPQVAPSMSQ